MENNPLKVTRHGFSAVITFVVSDEDIDDIMSAALDGGIIYWCGRAEVVGEYLSQYASEQISRGGALKLHDIEGDGVFELTLDKFLVGLRLWIENERAFELTKAGRLDIGQIDAAAADLIIQYALFNDIMYG